MPPDTDLELARTRGALVQVPLGGEGEEELRCLGIYGVLKTWRKRIANLTNQLNTEVFVEQPWLHGVC